jgi:hypothetical protein
MRPLEFKGRMGSFEFECRMGQFKCLTGPWKFVVIMRPLEFKGRMGW